MIAVIDYGMGNLGSVSNAIRSLGGDVLVTQKPSDLKKADKIILPGVGAFRNAMDGLTDLKLVNPLKEELEKGKLYLGLCLGLQLLFKRSVEGTGSAGLGIFEGNVVRFKQDTLKIPHMGWNQVEIKNNCPLFNDIENNSFFYFVHSYYVKPVEEDIVAGVTDYGTKFTSMVWKKNIYAMQFHPERSQDIGLKLLKNFMEL